MSSVLEAIKKFNKRFDLLEDSIQEQRQEYTDKFVAVEAKFPCKLDAASSSGEGAAVAGLAQ